VHAVQKANRVKQKLRKLFTNIDSAKSGSIADQAFVDILQLNGVTLRENAHHTLLSKARGMGPGGAAGSFIKYREALGMVNVDVDLVGEGQDPLTSPWIFKIGAGLAEGGSAGVPLQSEHHRDLHDDTESMQT